jgi:DNA transposition AAA+ family ATPase
MIAQGTDAKDVTSEQIATVAADVENFCKGNGVSRKAVAKAVGYSAGVISEFLKGTYAGNAGQVAIDLDDWLVAEEARRASEQKTTFVWTNVAQQIRAVAQYCLDKRKVGLVYGPETSGIGKTTSLMAVAQELGPRRAALVTIDKADSSPTLLLKKILRALGLDQSGKTAGLMARIVEHLNGRSHILLIDQVHNLRYSKEDRPLYYLMDLYEATKTSQLWAGTSDMVAYLQRQKEKTLDEPLAQIRSRIYPCLDLMEVCGGEGDGGAPLCTVDDIRAMFSRFQLKLTTAGARWVCTIARIPGSGALRTATNIVEYAVMLGQMRRQPSIDIPLLKEALKASLTVERANALINATDAMLGGEVTVRAKIG